MFRCVIKNGNESTFRIMSQISILKFSFPLIH